MEVKFYGVNEVDDSLLFAAVIVSRYKGKWVLCKHKDRDTWEMPGGHREGNESILDTAKRELYELPQSEIERIDFFSEIPCNLTYPLLHQKLLDKVKDTLHIV